MAYPVYFKAYVRYFHIFPYIMHLFNLNIFRLFLTVAAISGCGCTGSGGLGTFVFNEFYSFKFNNHSIIVLIILNFNGYRWDREFVRFTGWDIFRFSFECNLFFIIYIHYYNIYSFLLNLILPGIDGGGSGTLDLILFNFISIIILTILNFNL